MKISIIRISVVFFCLVIVSTVYAQVVVVPLGGDTGSAASNAFTNGSITIVGTTTVQTLVVTLPTSGNLVVFATWLFDFDEDEGGDCSIRLNSATYSSTFSNGSFSADPSPDQRSSSVTGVFTGVSSGAQTVHLVCRPDTGDSITVRKRSLTALFVPNQL